MSRFIRYLGDSTPSLTKNKVYEVINFQLIDDLGDEAFMMIAFGNWENVTYNFKEGSRTRAHHKLKKAKKS